MGPKNWNVTSHKAGKDAKDKCSSLLGPFESYEENRVLWICPPGVNVINLFFGVIYDIVAVFTWVMTEATLLRMYIAHKNLL